jgi:hypothetical protein
MSTASKLEDPTPVRLYAGTTARLQRVATLYRLRPAELIRRAVDSQLLSWEKGNPITITPTPAK